MSSDSNSLIYISIHLSDINYCLTFKSVSLPEIKYQLTKDLEQTEYGTSYLRFNSTSPLIRD